MCFQEAQNGSKPLLSALDFRENSIAHESFLKQLGIKGI